MNQYKHNPREFGRFEIIKRLGGGYFADVYEAVDPFCPDDGIALKILKDAFLDAPESPQIIERFTREANLTKLLSHPGLVKTREFGQIDGRFFIAMDLVPGKTLATLLREKRCLTWDQAIMIVDKLADALDYLHKNQVIHRDLKPSNLIIGDKEVTITDLGLAFIKGLASITYSGQVAGTPPYIAPEIFLQPSYRKGAPTPATDIYALGCILYEMLMGERLFDVEQPSEAYHSHVIRGAQLPDTWPPSVPPKFRTILGFAVAKDMDSRYESAGKFAQALRGLETDQIILPKFRPKHNFPIKKRVWSTYADVKQIRHLTIYKNFLWMATSGGICGLDLDKHSSWRFTTSEGLPDNEVNSIAFEPSTGRLWAATEHGLCYSIDSYFPEERPLEPISDIMDNKVRCVLTMQDGEVWCATERGVLRLRNGQCDTFKEAEGMAEFNAYCLVAGPDQKPWAGTASGVVRFDGKTWRRLPNDISGGKRISVMHTASNNAVWMGGTRGLLRYSNELWSEFTTANGLPSNTILDLSGDPHGEIWIGTAEGLAHMVDNKCEKVDLQLRSGQRASRIEALAWDPQIGGFLWLQTRDGLYYYDGNRAYPWEEELGLLDNHVYSVYRDNRNNMWFGTHNGLSFHSYKGKPRWKSYSSSDQFYGPLKGITEYPEGVIWFGTQQGVFQLIRGDSPEWRHHGAGSGGLPGDHANALLFVAPLQELWVATNAGLGIWNGRDWRQIRRQAGLINENILCLEADPLGGVWCGTDGGGATYWNGTSWQSYGDADGLRGRVVTGISCRHQDNSLWFATDQGAYQRTSDGVFKHIILPPQAGIVVRCVFADRGGFIWFGTDNGAVCYNSDGTSQLFTTRDGLAGNQVGAIWQCSQKSLWFATNRGVSSLD